MTRIDLPIFDFEELEQSYAEGNHVESPSLSLSFTAFERFQTTLDMLYIGRKPVVWSRGLCP
jgi:hypothetical protein